jgi:hypothetical protein
VITPSRWAFGPSSSRRFRSRAATRCLGGNTFGHVIGYLWATLVIVESFLMFHTEPWYAFAALLLGVLVIYALSTTSGWTDDSTEPRVLS